MKTKQPPKGRPSGQQTSTADASRPKSTSNAPQTSSESKPTESPSVPASPWERQLSKASTKDKGFLARAESIRDDLDQAAKDTNDPYYTAARGAAHDVVAQIKRRIKDGARFS